MGRAYSKIFIAIHLLLILGLVKSLPNKLAEAVVDVQLNYAIDLANKLCRTPDYKSYQILQDAYGRMKNKEQLIEKVKNLNWSACPGVNQVSMVFGADLLYVNSTGITIVEKMSGVLESKETRKKIMHKLSYFQVVALNETQVVDFIQDGVFLCPEKIISKTQKNLDLLDEKEIKVLSSTEISLKYLCSRIRSFVIKNKFIELSMAFNDVLGNHLFIKNLKDMQILINTVKGYNFPAAIITSERFQRLITLDGSNEEEDAYVLSESFIVSNYFGMIFNLLFPHHKSRLPWHMTVERLFSMGIKESALLFRSKIRQKLNSSQKNHLMNVELQNLASKNSYLNFSVFEVNETITRENLNKLISKINKDYTVEFSEEEAQMLKSPHLNAYLNQKIKDDAKIGKFFRLDHKMKKERLQYLETKNIMQLRKKVSKYSHLFENEQDRRYLHHVIQKLNIYTIKNCRKFVNDFNAKCDWTGLKKIKLCLI